MRLVWLCLLLALSGALRAAVPEMPRFRVLGPGDGLPSTTVPAIARDQEGYLWVATWDGLARYDGVGFRVWQHDPRDPASLPGNLIQALYVDGRNRIWVATEGGGVRSEEHTSELQSREKLVCRLLLEKTNRNSSWLEKKLEVIGISTYTAARNSLIRR